MNHNSLFINKVFNSLLSVKGSIGKTMNNLLEEYREEKIHLNDKSIIDSIRKRLATNPRPIVLTTDSKEHVIYDGWHTIIAFALEKKDINVYLGINDSFLCYNFK